MNEIDKLKQIKPTEMTPTLHTLHVILGEYMAPWQKTLESSLQDP